MKDIDKLAYLNRYNKRLLKHGNSPKTLGWGGGIERQYIRFENLLRIGVNDGDSVLDVGCGFGDLFGYTKKIGLDINYLGVDINSNLLEVALEKHPEINTKCVDINNYQFSSKFDWVLASGIFNAKLIAEDNITYFSKMLKNMFELSSKGVSVDFMHTFVDYEADGSFHTNPQDAIREAKKNSWEINLLMDYLPYECAIHIYKNNKEIIK
jgi:cyclopropane fatty-acyl-phospholipid synthase-like methyltransferase